MSEMRKGNDPKYTILYITMILGPCLHPVTLENPASQSEVEVTKSTEIMPEEKLGKSCESTLVIRMNQLCSALHRCIKEFKTTESNCLFSSISSLATFIFIEIQQTLCKTQM